MVLKDIAGQMDALLVLLSALRDAGLDACDKVAVAPKSLVVFAVSAVSIVKLNICVQTEV